MKLYLLIFIILIGCSNFPTSNTYHGYGWDEEYYDDDDDED